MNSPEEDQGRQGLERGCLDVCRRGAYGRVDFGLFCPENKGTESTAAELTARSSMTLVMGCARRGWEATHHLATVYEDSYRLNRSKVLAGRSIAAMVATLLTTGTFGLCQEKSRPKDSSPPVPAETKAIQEKTKAILAKLEKPLAIRCVEETPFEDCPQVHR